MQKDFGSVAKCIPFYIRNTVNNSSVFSVPVRRMKKIWNLHVHKWARVVDRKTGSLTPGFYLAILQLCRASISHYKIKMNLYWFLISLEHLLEKWYLFAEEVPITAELYWFVSDEKWAWCQIILSSGAMCLFYFLFFSQGEYRYLKLYYFP